MEMYLDSRGLAPPVTEDTPTQEVVAWTLDRFSDQRMIMTTSFGMEGCALVDMYAKADTRLTVVYLDTMFFFPETYALRDQLVERYPHINFVNGGTQLTPEQQAIEHGEALWKTNPDLCCSSAIRVRKNFCRRFGGGRAASSTSPSRPRRFTSCYLSRNPRSTAATSATSAPSTLWSVCKRIECGIAARTYEAESRPLRLHRAASDKIRPAPSPAIVSARASKPP